jgi:hypothetical protein
MMTARDVEMAVAYLRHYASVRNWPRLDDCAEVLEQTNTELEELKIALKKAKRYKRVPGADSRTEITLVWQERDFEQVDAFLSVD